MTTTTEKRRAMTIAGDARDTVGQIRGPNASGELLIIDSAVYACPECGQEEGIGSSSAPQHRPGCSLPAYRTRLSLRVPTDAEVQAAAARERPDDRATPSWDLPIALAGALGYVDVACDGCGAVTREYGISSESRGWALCPDCRSKPDAHAKIEAKRREIHEQGKRAQAEEIESRRPPAQTGTVGIRLIGMADGTPSPWDGQWLVEYDPTRPGTAPDGRPAVAHIVTTDDPAQAARYLDAVAAFEEWRRPSGNPYPANAPLTAFTASFEDPDEAQ